MLGRSFVLAAALTLTTSVAFAAPTASDKAAAEALYDEGRTLLRSGKLEEACAKLAESQRLDPGIGTLLYLAEGYERLGKLASAWATFREAYGSAHAAGQEDRAKLAQNRAATLEPKLPKLTLRLTDPVPGTEVRHDDAIVRSGLLGTATPVDPGAHTIVVRAPGYVEWKKTVQLEPAGAVTIDIPALEKTPEAPVVTTVVQEPPPPAPITTAPTPPEGMPGRKKGALVVGGLGIVGLGIGSFAGMSAFSSWSDAETGCPNDRCTSAGRSAADSASTSATISTIAFVAGAAFLVGAAVLWFGGSSTSSRTNQAR